MIWLIGAVVWMLLAVALAASWARFRSLEQAHCQCGHPNWPDWVHGADACFPVREML